MQSLGALFSVWVTAEDVRSYKPAAAHFEAGLERLELSRERVLHVAQSLRHDIRPAQQLGWATAWVNRLDEELPPDSRPDIVVSSLQELVERLEPRPREARG